MKNADAYLTWVEWSEEDELYVGRCPDLFFGGCHGGDPVAIYKELCEMADDMVKDYQREGKSLPEVRTRPLVAA